MSLAFLYPLAWLGTLAIAVPLWLHLRRRDEANLVRFSAMQFLDDAPPAKRRPLWPRDWPLLLLRLAALLLVVAAFSWPYLRGPKQALIEESRVYLLDNTLSHQAEGGFEKSRDEILRELGSGGIETQIAVVELAAVPRVVAAFSDDRAAAIERVRALAPSSQRGSYVAAFRMAAGLLNQSLGQEKRIVLLGDSQENQWAEGRQSIPFLENTEVTLPEIEVKSRPNLALWRPNVQRVFAGDRVLAECAVRLYRQGDQAATVVFRADGREIQRRVVQPAGPPGVTTLFAQWEVDPSQWVRGEVRLEGNSDSLPGDDRAFFSLPPVREGRVALLARSPFLRTALAPEVMKGRWNCRLLDDSDLGNSARDPLADEVLCLEGQFLQAAPARRMIGDFLDRGKGVVLLLDQATPSVSGFLRELGIEVASQTDVPEGRRQFRYVFAEHPIFQPFRSADFGNLAEIEVGRYRRLQATAGSPLVFSGQGDPLLLEMEKKGRLLVLAFALDRSETNWPIHPTFIPFLDRLLSHARQQSSPPSEYEPGEAVVWQVPPGRSAREVIVAAAAAPGKPVLRVPVAAGQARLTVPDAPGLYEVRYEERGEVESVLAVNPSPEESRLSYIDPRETVAGWTVQAAGDTSKAADPEAIEPSKLEIYRQHAWWWLLLAGLAATLAETFWLALRKGWA